MTERNGGVGMLKGRDVVAYEIGCQNADRGGIARGQKQRNRSVQNVEGRKQDLSG